ncbi:calcium-binding protein [Polaromonas sp. CT11-55]|uniref:calcium-binding protein n=1 Tax=Polaromonas sp. CT11-55 TaxID=3243045 RepID=UPI0039A73D1C
MDKLSNLLFGANSTITTPLPADLNGEKFTVDASLTRDEMVTNAKRSDGVGMAWRYALRELNSFVITDVSYAAHNTDGSLDLYDKDTNPGGLTNEYLVDRAAMLAWKLQFEKYGARDDNDPIIRGGRGAKPYTEKWDSNTVQGNWDFIALDTKLPGGAPLQLSIDGQGLSVYDHQVVFGGKAADVINGSGDSDRLYGMAGNDTLSGKGGADYMEGGGGNDTLDGGADNDTLVGGVGSDIYAFNGAFGKDTVLDADGLGQIKIDGSAVFSASSVGRNAWVALLVSGDKANLNVYDDARSSTGKKLVITRPGSVDNAVTITNFDLAKALGSEGYLGINLESTVKLIIEEDAGSNPFQDVSFNPASVNGSSLINEGGGTAYSIFLNKAAKAGDTVTLALSALKDKFKIILGNTTIDADGAVITLTEGQTEVKILLVQKGDITADASTLLSASYQGVPAGGSLTGSTNTWTVNVKDTGDAAHIFNGDQHGQLITDPETGHQSYDWNSAAWAADGTLAGGVVEAGYRDIINGGAGNDKISGLGGNDLLYGGAGNDEIDGGDGDDLIGGGAGSDTIHGGAGNDTILSATNVTGFQRSGPGDTWSPTLAANGGGIQMDDASDVIDAGDGNDFVYAGRGNDRIEGGAGVDVLYGGAGNDIVEGGAGDDTLVGDGSNMPNTYVSVAGADHGNDFLDGGDGNDSLIGFGKDDVLYGGAGNDLIFGDGYAGAQTDNSAYLAAQYHGNDYIDGEDGDDYVEGNGGADTIYGGDGADTLWGDAASHILSGEFHGADYIDGEAGNDDIVGGGADDTLYGGDGNDRIRGDLSGVMPGAVGYLTGQYHGNDYIDGEDGDDYAEGDGGADTIYGGDGADNLWGDAAADILGGEFHGADYIDGEAGNDDIVGGGADDTLYGGAGNDRIRGDSSGLMQGAAGYLDGQYHGNDYLNGEDGNDQMIGDGGSDTLYGGAGDDVLYGDATQGELAGAFHGNDYLDGGDGDDVLRGGGGNDTLYGGSGNDTLNGDDEPENLAAQFHGNDYLDGGDGDDVLKGGGGNDTLYGGKGNDTLIGGDGADLLDGGEGDDSYEAGAGDTVSDNSDGTNTLKLADSGPYTVSTSGADLVLNYGDSGNLRITGALGGSIASIDGMAMGDWLQSHLSENASLQSTADNQVLSGGAGDDELTAQHSGVTLRGGNGNDLLTGWAGNATLNGGDGNDVLDASGAANILTGDAGNDRLTAAGGDDTLDGGVGNDILSGGAGSDTLQGGAGDDVIDGGDGDDRLSGGSGIDILRGGDGLDTYVLGYGMGQATLEDHSPEGSVIELDASGLQLESLTARRVNNDLEVGVRGTDTRMLVKDYYGATQTSLLFKDPQGNTLSVQALVDASTPQWVNLQGSLIETAKAEARSRIGAEYSAQGYARQADGGWYIADALRLLDNNSYEYVTTTTYTHQLMSNSSTTWTTPSTSVAGTQWAFSDSDWVDYASRSDTAVAVSDQSQTVSDEFISLASMSGSVSYQQIWRGVAWSVRSSEAGTTTNPRIQYVRSEPGSPPEIITEESSSTYLTRFYSGLDTGITLEDPGAAATAGPLPAYVSGVFAHRQWNYQLGQVTLSDGNHTVMADGYSSVIGGVGDNIIYNAGFAYGGTGNAILSGGNTLMAGSGDQYLEYGKTMVVGDGHDTVLARAYRRFELYYGTSTPRETVRILVDPNNTGMDLLLSEHELSNGGLDQNRNGLDDVIESIYQEQGFSYGSIIQYSYQHGGKYSSVFGGFFDTLEAARSAYYEQREGSSYYYNKEWSDEFASYIKPLPALFRNPGFADVLQSWGPASDYYDSHPLQTILLTANNFAVLQPYLEAGLLPLKTVVFGPGLSLADIGLSWGVAVSPLDGEARVTLKLQWGPDQGVQVMIPRTDDVLNAAIQKFEFADGSTVWLQDLIAMAPPAPDFDLGYAQLHAGMGAQSADAADVTGIHALVASASELKVESDGVDLVISIIGSSDSLRIAGWYADPDAMSRAILFTSGNTALSSAELTDRGLIKDGSAGDMDLHGIPGFATTFIAGPNTRMTGNSGMDIYVYNAGSGEVHITDPGGGAVRFGSGVSATATLGLGDGSLLIQLGNQDDKIYLENFDPSNAGNFQSVWNFEFAGGSTLNLQDLLNQGFDLSGTADAETINGTSVTDRILGGAGDDVLRGGRGDDTLDGGAGSDVYLFSRGDGVDTINESDATPGNVDTIRFDDSVSVADVRVSREGLNLYLGTDGSTDRIQISNWFADGANTVEQVEFADGTVWNAQTLTDMAIFLGTPDQDDLVGSQGNDMLRGLDGDDILFGGDGFDVLEGGAGNDSLSDMAGSSNYFNGGSGDDQLLGSTGANLLIGGTGNDAITSDSGPDVIAFNVGDGQDTLYVNDSVPNLEDTISLGGAGLDYANLSLEKNGSDLVLKLSGTDQLTLADWYAGTPRQSVLNLQLVAEAMSAFDANSGDPLLNKKVQTFDFQGLVGAFDTARTATPGLSSWALSNGLTQFHLAGSDSEALGGDLAYHYGADGTLAGMGLGKAQEVLTNAQFGAQAQGIHSTASLQEGLVRLG